MALAGQTVVSFILRISLPLRALMMTLLSPHTKQPSVSDILQLFFNFQFLSLVDTLRTESSWIAAIVVEMLG